MDRSIYLLSLNISGVKNIEKEIRIDFYKKTIDKHFDPDKYRIKAIYGENGSGKTGIVMAVQILRELIINDNYLNETTNQVFLKEIVNKKTNRLHLECEFLFERNGELHVYQYVIEVSGDKSDKYVITSEKLARKTIRTKNTKYVPIYECRNGELLYFWADDVIKHELKMRTANLLSKSSFPPNSLRYFLDNSKGKELEFGFPVIDLLLFGFSLAIYLETEDQHITYLIQASLKNDGDDVDTLKKVHDLIYKDYQDNSVTNTRISKKEYKAYFNKIKQLERFLRVFKTDIKRIDIDKHENKGFYECRLLINYGEYWVDSEFESKGLKKLIRLFESLQAAANGKIVFIDEMDSNINDIYLCKLVEFMMYYGEGQLCFTTHNTSPMTILKKNKKSIDFLSSDNHIVPWKTNGNYQPDSLYKQGLIPYLPFNIEPEDFIGILGE